MENRRTLVRGVGETILVLFAVSGIFWVFFGKYLAGRHSVSTFVDNTFLLHPLFVYISKSFASGEFPYWINSILGGIPLYNTPQFSVLYPFYFFGWNFYRTPLDTSLHLHYVTLLHVAILWLNTYVLMRVVHLRILSSILGATLFAFCANTYSYLFWVNIVSPYSWLPLALASVLLILENRYSKAGLVLGCISIYLMTSASPAQPLIHFVYCAGFLAASYAWIHRKEIFKLRVPLRNLILLGIGSLVLSAPSLVPTFIFSQRDMIRWTEVGPIVGNQPIPFKGFMRGQTKATELAKVFFPMNVDQVLGDSYLGIVPVFLALFAGFKSKQNWIVIPLCCLALYTLLSSTGSNLGFAYINYMVPLWNKIREPARHLFIFGLAACTLAAFGFEYLTEPQGFTAFRWRRNAIVVAAFLVLLIGSYWVRQSYTTRITDSVLFWSFASFLIVLPASRLLPRRANGIAGAVLAGIAVYPMLSYPPPMVSTRDSDYFKADNLRSHRVLQELAKFDDISKYRLVVRDDRFSTQWWSMNGIYYGLRTMEAYMNPLPSTQNTEISLIFPIARYGRLLGAKYYLTCNDPPIVPSDYALERDIEGCKLFLTQHAQPYFVLFGEAEPYRTVEEFFNTLEANDAELKKVLIPAEDAGKVAAWLGSATQPLNWETFEESHSLNSFDLGLKTTRRSVLVVNEYFRRDWQVTVNGESQKLLKVNLNQIGVLLPEGTSHVRFEYRPRLFVGLLYTQRAGLAILAMAIIGMAVSTARHASRDEHDVSEVDPQPDSTR